MKNIISKLFIFVILLIGFVSCEEEHKTQVDSTKETLWVTNVGEIKIVKYDYEGHSYQMHYHPSGNATVAGVVHDPNCKCFKNFND